MRVGIVGVLLAVTIVASHAQHMHPSGPAADWYEQSCCSNRDCAPVADDVVENRKDGVFVKGYGIMSYTDPRLRWSRDDKDHVCSARQPNGSMKLNCLYRRFNGL